jgi:hypothetical protein
MVDTLTSGAIPGTEDLKRFWQEVPFFGSRVEEFLSRYWYFLLLVPCGALIVWGFWLDKTYSTPHSFASITTMLRNPYVGSLYVALFLSAIAFSVWRSTIRNTFSTAFDSGIVSSTAEGIRDFRPASIRFSQLMCSPRRFLPIAATVLPTMVLAALPLLSAIKENGSPLDLFLDIVMFISLGVFSYAVGAVAWCFISAAVWIASLSRDKILQIQPGHSDSCCGLERVGNCCLQSALPLVIGMLLCLLWSNSDHAPGFRHYQNEGWVSFIIPVSEGLLIVIFGLACALVFLPVRGLHAQLTAYKQRREREFTGALETELSRVDECLAAEDQTRVENLSDRIKLVQMLDPVKLKLATWPFNSASLLKYGVTPLASLAVSLGKDVAKNLMP